MFVLGETFNDVTLHVGVKINDKSWSLERVCSTLGGAGHVARLLRAATGRSVHLLACTADGLQFVEDVTVPQLARCPARVTLVENGIVRRFIQPTSHYRPLTNTDVSVIEQAQEAWKNSSVVYVCSHGYADLSPILDELAKFSAAPKTYFVSGEPEFFRYRFGGPCYFFTNRALFKSWDPNLVMLASEFSDSPAFGRTTRDLTAWWDMITERNDVKGVFVTLDVSGVVVIGLPVEEHHCLRASSGPPCVAWYPSRVKYLVDDVGCGDAFMVGVSLNLATDTPIRAGLLAAKDCAQYAGTACTL